MVKQGRVEHALETILSNLKPKPGQKIVGMLNCENRVAAMEARIAKQNNQPVHAHACHELTVCNNAA